MLSCLVHLRDFLLILRLSSFLPPWQVVPLPPQALVISTVQLPSLVTAAQALLITITATPSLFRVARLRFHGTSYNSGGGGGGPQLSMSFILSEILNRPLSCALHLLSSLLVTFLV